MKSFQEFITLIEAFNDFFRDLYSYYGWFDLPNEDFLFPKEFDESHYDIIFGRFNKMGKAFDAGLVRFLSENRLDKTLLMETSTQFVKNIGIDNFVGDLKRMVEKLEMMIAREKMPRLFGRRPKLPEVLGITFYPEMFEIRGHRDNFFQILKNELKTRLETPQTQPPNNRRK
ncbi:MAG: hypothetical protein N3A54_00140 [Patescibacteria group bacterium]|nr:hypothetical protein [Patescibacteria group bacterium]